MAEREGLMLAHPWARTIFGALGASRSAVLPIGRTPAVVLIAANKKASAEEASLIGGEGGIRTPGRLQTFNGFQDRRIRPLCHLSVRLDCT